MVESTKMLDTHDSSLPIPKDYVVNLETGDVTDQKGEVLLSTLTAFSTSAHKEVIHKAGEISVEPGKHAISTKFAVALTTVNTAALAHETAQKNMY